MRGTPALGPSAFDFQCVCGVPKKKNDRTVTPFVQTIGFHNKSRILFGEETTTHVCHAV